MGAFRYRQMASWPPLAWLAVCDPRDARPLVVHGARVETRDDWFCEAVWDGDFARGGFDERDCVWGSGARVRGADVRFVSSSAPLDRLHHVQRGGRSFVSNSFTALLVGAGLEPDPTYAGYLKDFMSVKRGYRDCVRVLRTDAEPAELTYYDDLLWSEGGLRRVPKRHVKVELGSYEAYRRFLDETLARLLANARSPDRGHRYEPIGALSSGIDSSASMALAAPHGLREAFSFRQARFGADDSGRPTARALGLELHEFDRDAWRDLELPEVPFFLGDARGPDVFYRPAEPLLAGRLLLTGYCGGGLWGLKGRIEGDDLRRVDTSGLSLAEYRLWTGSLHLPVPTLGYRQAHEVDALGRTRELEPWRVGRRTYQKPIARRILQEAGVPAGDIARFNRAATVLWVAERTFLAPSSLADFAAWLRRNEARLTPAHGGRPVADLPVGGWRADLGHRLSELARHAPGRQRIAKAASRVLLRRSDPTPLLRYFLPWAFEHGRRRYPRPDLGQGPA